MKSKQQYIIQSLSFEEPPPVQEGDRVRSKQYLYLGAWSDEYAPGLYGTVSDIAPDGDVEITLDLDGEEFPIYTSQSDFFILFDIVRRR